MKILSAVLVAVMSATSVVAKDSSTAIDVLKSMAGDAGNFAGLESGLLQITPKTNFDDIRLELVQKTKAGKIDKADAAHKRLPMDKKLIYVLDGDTIYYGEKGSEKLKIRIAGIDTPEIKHYSAGKFEGQEFGQEATKQGRAIILRAKKVEYMPLGLDKYGRTLAHIFVDGELYAVKILEKGLAYETITTYGDNGCPEIAASILKTAAAYAHLPFENPHDWRAREWSEEKEQAELRKDLALKRTAIEKSLIRFDDGDTFFYKDLTLRILGMDTPEIIHEKDGIFENQPYGPEAAKLTKKLISKARTVEYIAGRKDLYGRTLAHVFVDGELLSVLLIKAGLAYEDISMFGATGFPGYARIILKAGRSMPTPPFENPLYWRAKHQQKETKSFNVFPFRAVFQPEAVFGAI